MKDTYTSKSGKKFTVGEQGDVVLNDGYRYQIGSAPSMDLTPAQARKLPAGVSAKDVVVCCGTMIMRDLDVICKANYAEWQQSQDQRLRDRVDYTDAALTQATSLNSAREIIARDINAACIVCQMRAGKSYADAVQSSYKMALVSGIVEQITDRIYHLGIED